MKNSDHPKAEPSASKCRTIGKILLWVVGILVVLRIALSLGGVPITNRILPGVLGTAASIETLDLALSRGKLSAAGITVYQPAGFEGGPLLSLGEVAVDINMRTLVGGPLSVESASVDRLEVNLVRNKDGILNVATLAGGSDTNAPAEPEPEDDEPSSSPTAVAVRELHVRELVFSYRDLAHDPPLVVHVADCNASVTNLVFDPGNAGEPLLSGNAVLTALLKQPDFHDAFVGLTARFGVLTTDPPPVVAAARIVGLELKSGVDAVVPPGVIQTLGGSCVDAYVDVTMAVDVLDFRLKLKTEDNTMPFAIGGTPSDWHIDKSTALFNLVSRPTMLVGGVVTDVGSAGVEVVEGAAKTTAAVGKGALSVVGNLGKGVFKTAKGVATADLSEVGDGLKTATVGTVTETAEAIADTATTAVKGVGDTATEVIGKDDADAWRDGCEARWHEQWDAARAEVLAAPYPRPEAKPAETEPDEAATTNETAEADAVEPPEM